MAQLKGSKTEADLRQAFASDSEANGRFLSLDQSAEAEAFDEIADWFDTVAWAERSHAGRLTAGLESLS